MYIPFHISNIFILGRDWNEEICQALHLTGTCARRASPSSASLGEADPSLAVIRWRILRQDPARPYGSVFRCVWLDGQYDCFLHMGDPPMLIMWTSCLGASLNPGQSCTDKELRWQRVGLQCWVKRLGGANTLWRMILRLRFGLKRGRKYFAASNSFAHSSSCSPTVKQTGPEKTFD